MGEGTTTTNQSVTVTRRPERFISDDKRVITRFFEIGGEGRIRAPTLATRLGCSR